MTISKWTTQLAFMLIVACAANAFAQTDQARISGTVRDKSGAWVAGASVKVKNEATGEERTATTSDQGVFTVPALRPASYTIRVEKAGFSPIEYANMPLSLGQVLSLDFKFEVAGMSEVVNVTAVTPVLDASSARMGVNVTPFEVNNLPVNGRQMSQLLLQAPGAQNAGTGTWQDIRFSGRAVEQNAVRYDGVEGSAIIDSAPGNVNGENNTPFKLQASLENVQEFRVESSSYPAEYGTGTGGQISVVTKSGTNRLHGAAFEYARRDRWDAPNYFDALRNPDGTIQANNPKSPLKQDQFGGSIGGPLATNRAFFFGSYESYRLKAGKNFVEAVPSAAAWGRAVPAIAALRANFLAPSAVIIPGGSGDVDFDIAQNRATQVVKETAFSTRLDFKVTTGWTTYVRFFRDSGTNDDPQGVTGRRFLTTSKPMNFVFGLQGLVGADVNEFKIGYNSADTTERGVTQPAFDGIAISLTGQVANTGISGQGASSSVAAPGGLVRVNSAGNGRSAPYNPYSVTLADALTHVRDRHTMKFGAEARLIRMSTDQQGGITYSFPNITAFLNNTPGNIQYFGDLSEPSPFNNGATGLHHLQQQYYVGFAQDEWRVRSNVTLNLGLRYDYYTVMRESDNRITKFNIITGAIDANTTPFYQSKKNGFQPRLAMTFSPTSLTIIRAGGGLFVGPGQTEDQIQPIEGDRINTTLSGGAYPIDPALIKSNFTGNPNGRSFQPRAYANDYTLPERVYEYSLSLQRELPGKVAATVAYVGAQGRNLFLRSIANRTVGILQTNPAAGATNIREFDIVTCANGNVQDGRATALTSATICPGSSALSKQSPYAEIDYKTSGGRDKYNAFQLSVTRQAPGGVTMNAQYTYAVSKGTTGGSNEADTAGNNARALADWEYDYGYNKFDVRHGLNVSLLYPLPFGKGRRFLADASGAKQALLGGWDVGAIVNARSGTPIAVFIGRNDIVYVDPAGNVWNNAAADRVAVINTPGGGITRTTRRPDLVPGVDPYKTSGGLLFLNPAAFATPKPGTFGNLTRNAIHGPNVQQTDLVVSKKFETGGHSNAEFRVEIFNMFNIVNFAGISGTLPNALPGAGESVTQANRVQPGQPYTASAGGTFGRATSTVGTTVGLGTPRQVQLALRFNF